MKQAWKQTAARLPLLIANTAENFFLDNFRKQGWQGDNGLEPWKPREDTSEKSTGRAILVKKAVLKRSLTKYVNGLIIRIVVTGIAARYAGIHNSGGTIQHKGGEKKLSFRRLKGGRVRFTSENGRHKVIAQAKVKIGAYTIRMPQRKFIGNSKQLNAKLQKLFIRELNKTFNSK